jgi:flagellar protein FlgJ
MAMQIGSLQTESSTEKQPPQVSPRLARAAHEFEGQMLKELLQPLMAGNGLAGGEDDAGANATLGEFGAEALGQALSRQGGFGIADRIVHDLSHSGKRDHPGKVTGNVHSNTVMSRAE